MKEEVKEGLREQGRELKRKEEMRREFREMKGRWGKEREELRAKELEEKMEALETSRKEGEEEEEGKEIGTKVMKRVKEIERKLEWREREERGKNIIVRGVEVREGKRREAVERILEMVGARVDIIQEVKKLRGEGEMVLVKLRNEGTEKGGDGEEE